MKKIEYKNILKKDNGINYIASAITPWHYIGCKAAIECIKEKHNYAKGHILIYPHGLTGLCIDKEDEIEKNGNVYIVDYDKGNLKSKVKTIFGCVSFFLSKTTKDNPIYIISPMKPNWNILSLAHSIFPKRNLICFIISEGIGDSQVNSLFAQKLKYSRRIKEYKKKKNIVKIMYIRLISIVDIITSLLFLKILKIKGCIIDERLFYMQNNRLEINTNIVKYYKKALGNEKSQLNNETYKNSVLINAQLEDCIDKYGNDVEKNTIKKCIEICKINNVDVVIKQHPRDNNLLRFADLKCRFDVRKNLSQETLIARSKYKPICVIGVSSTSLITLKLFFNIPAISLARMVFDSVEDKLVKEQLQDYINKYSSMINMPQSNEGLMDEITKAINGAI